MITDPDQDYLKGDAPLNGLRHEDFADEGQLCAKGCLIAFRHTQNAPLKLYEEDIKRILSGTANHNNYFGDF